MESSAEPGQTTTVGEGEPRSTVRCESTIIAEGKLDVQDPNQTMTVGASVPAFPSASTSS